MTIAIIAARGGSKRLPRKNVREFCGHPLIAWAITAARTSKHIDAVYCTTDDDEIEAVARKYGAEVIRRPDWPDADFAAANRPFAHAIQHLLAIHPDFDTVLTILPTCPLIKPGDFDMAVEKFRELGADSIAPAIPRRELIAMKRLSPNRSRTVIFGKKYEYFGEGGGYCVTTPTWYLGYCAEQKSDLDADLDKMENWTRTEWYVFPVECWQYGDVDTAEEFHLAELVMNHYILKGRGMAVYWDYADSHAKKQETVLQYGNSAQIYGGY